jgi:F0F1-type ATP synthase beta subunit
MTCGSRIIEPDTIGAEHYKTNRDIVRMLFRYKELKDDKYYVPFDMPDFEELDLYVEHLEMCLDRWLLLE